MTEIPDYANYTLAELYQALNSIRSDLYPEVYSALDAELRGRKSAPRFELEQIYYALDAKKWPDHEAILRQQINTHEDGPAPLFTEITEENKYQTFWPRVGAIIVDAVVLTVPIAIVIVLAWDTVVEGSIGGAWIDQGLNYFGLAYYISLHAMFGQTVGKKAAGVKVVRAVDEEPISWQQAILRDIFPVLYSIFITVFLIYLGVAETDEGLTETAQMIVNAVALVALLWAVAEIVTMLFNKKRRAVHDFIARTVVIRIP